MHLDNKFMHIIMLYICITGMHLDNKFMHIIMLFNIIVFYWLA